MKKIVLFSLVAAAAATSSFATGNDSAACKGGITGFGGGLNADVFGTGGATCSFSGETTFETTTTFDNSGVFSGAFQFNQGSRQNFAIAKETDHGGFNATLNQGNGIQILDDTATGTFSNAGEITTTNGRVTGEVFTNGNGGCKGGLTGTAGGFNGDVACTGDATANFFGKQDYHVTETSSQTVNFDDAAFAAGGGSIQTFNSLHTTDSGSVSTSLTQGTGFQVSGTATGQFNTETTTTGRGWVMGTTCVGNC